MKPMPNPSDPLFRCLDGLPVFPCGHRIPMRACTKKMRRRATQPSRSTTRGFFRSRSLKENMDMRNIQKDNMDMRKRKALRSCDNERRVRIRNTVSVAEDLIFNEILVRLPVKTLLKFKRVSKSWYDNISSPCFTDLHLQHAKKSPKLLITTLVMEIGDVMSMYRYDDMSRRADLVFSLEIPELLESLLPVSHANGLLLLNNATELIVCNPSTRDYLTLPKGTENEDTDHIDPEENRAGFCYVSSINAYKVGQYFYRESGKGIEAWSTGFEVFTLGVDTVWRTIEEEPPYRFRGNTLNSVGESIYFNVDGYPEREKLCVAFDLSGEKFRVVNYPEHFSCYIADRGFTELKGDTCFFTVSGDESIMFDIWIKKDKKIDAWTHIFKVKLIEPTIEVSLVGTSNENFMLWTKGSMRNGRIVGQNFNSFKFTCYNPQTERLETEKTVFNFIRDIKYYNLRRHKLHKESFFRVNSYVESLVPVIPKKSGY